MTKLQAFLGLANYYIPKMYELRDPLYELVKKKGKKMVLD